MRDSLAAFFLFLVTIFLISGCRDATRRANQSDHFAGRNEFWLHTYGDQPDPNGQRIQHQRGRHDHGQFDHAQHYAAQSCQRTVPITLGPGERADYGIEFTPDSATSFSGHLTFSVTGGGGNEAVNVTGNGANVAAVPHSAQTH